MSENCFILVLESAAAVPTYAETVDGLSPLSYWRLNESSGTTAADEETTNDGTIVGSATLSAGRLLNDDSTNRCIRFNNATEDQYIEVANIFTTSDFTISFLVQPVFSQPYMNNTETFVSQYDNGTSDGFTIRRNSSTGYLEFILKDQSLTSTCTNEVAMNRSFPNHVVATFETGTGTSLYVNGVLVDSDATITAALSLSATPKLVLGGQDHTTKLAMQGYLDEVAIFNSALSAVQVNNLYQAAGLS